MLLGWRRRMRPRRSGSKFSGSGSNEGTGDSSEYTQMTPPRTPRRRRRTRTWRASGHTRVASMSATRTWPGSDLAAAPMLLRVIHPCARPCSSRLTLQLRPSIASTSTGYASRSSGGSRLPRASGARNSARASTSVSGQTSRAHSPRTSVLKRPTSAGPATGWRLREAVVTRSKSTRSRRPTPLRARLTAQWAPTPPRPATITPPARMRAKPSAP